MNGKIKILVLALVVFIGINVANAQAPVKPPKRPTTTQQTKQKPQSQKAQNTQPQKPNKASGTATGVINGHEWVNLGLPSGTKWATCNIGASSPSDYGDYYAWGETSPKSNYTRYTSKLYGYGYELGSLKDQGVVDSEGNLIPLYDAASQKWGDSWRMPTFDEIKELVDKCRWECTKNGVQHGYMVIGPNGNSIYLPAAGYRNGTRLYEVYFDGSYWSATANNNDSGSYNLYFSSSNHNYKSYSRYYGLSIRPVTK